MRFHPIYKCFFVLTGLCFLVINQSYALGTFFQEKDTTPVSTQQQAIAFIRKIDTLPISAYWPNISPRSFLENIRSNIYKPLGLYEGISTNFCGYAALSYLLLHDNPLLYARFMIELYESGEATMGKTTFHPSLEIKQAAGKLRFKGVLDIRSADQMWFLSLADHFKGYLNFFDKHYNAGDEDKLWASVNYAKFNRMIRTLFNYKVTAKGSDLIRPKVGNLYQYINERMNSGTMVLYLNNTFLYKKSHSVIKLGVPTHYIILESISRVENTITIVYWDYGGRSLRQISPAFLKKIVFGISHCTKKEADAK